MVADCCIATRDGRNVTFIEKVTLTETVFLAERVLQVVYILQSAFNSANM